MKPTTPRYISAAAVATLPLALATLLLAQIPNKDDEEVFELSPFEVSTGFGATPGGTQDISYARDQIDLGNIPHPNTFKAEGLLSEHDLPLAGQPRTEALVSVHGEAMPAALAELPEAAFLAQIGFASGLDATTWRRPPLNLIAVVDKSGSMSGQPLALVRESLLTALSKLDEGDQISVVLYGERSYTHLEPTRVSRANRSVIERSIQAIDSGGSTNMENGLAVGYELARRTAPGFDGATRLMLFTDERPNTGNTSKEGFMGQMRAGSLSGYGLTTIGVGTHFGAELANALSSVRGGNLFYFPDRESMVAKFEDEFETMVSELAYDLTVTIAPERGYRIAGIYGVPGNLLAWSEDGRALSLEIETLFLSLRKGAIYFAIAPELHRDMPIRQLRDTRSVASVSIAYQTAGQSAVTQQTFRFVPLSREQASVGLRRGESLIDEYISLKKATTAHHVDNDSETAYRIVSSLASRLRSSGDTDLASELAFVTQLEQQLAMLSGHGSEVLGHRPGPLGGIWVAELADNDFLDEPLVFQFLGERTLGISCIGDDGQLVPDGFAVARAPFPAAKRGVSSFLSQSEFAQRRLQLEAIAPPFASGVDYLADLESIEFRARGDTLRLIARQGHTAETIVLRRLEDEPTKRRTLDAADLEPISGLPSRG